MKRVYTLKRRAAQQADTRRRIVEAALKLHGSVGPGRTSLSMVAERAGVQRHTLYAHFPNERSLFLACSGLHLERDPLPEAAPWAEIAEPAARLRAGLGALYGWYARNAALAGCVMRDAEFHELTREVAALRFGPAMASYAEVLGAPLAEGPQRAMLALALSFFTWRSLTQAGLSPEQAVEAMARAVLSAG